MLDILNPLVSAGVGATLFSALFVVGLLIGGKRDGYNFTSPNAVLPALVQQLFPKNVASLVNANTVPYVGPVPWSGQGNAAISRASLKCILTTCTSQSYVVTLPKDKTTLYLSTQRHFRTNYPFTYPVATVAIIPKDSKTVFLMDADNGIDGLRPMILADNSLLNMGPTWDTNAPTPNTGFDCTGNYAHSFVVHNETSHTVYFATKAINSSQEASEHLKFWSLEPGSFTLMWPASVYWPISERLWNATSLPTVTYDFAAYAAETMMYKYLANKDPLAP